MSDSSDAHKGPVRPLTALTQGGDPYKRLEVVEIEIGRMLCLHQSEWLAAADDLKSETIVYLIHEVQQDDKYVFGQLFYELHRRIPRLASRWVRDFDPTTTEEILWKVEKDIFDLILAPKATAQTEYLEVAFGQAVKRRAINIVEKYANNPMVKRGEILPPPGQDGEPEKIKRPIELVEDDRAGQEAQVLETERLRLQPELLEKAYEKVKDPKDLEMFKLHHGEGIPIQSSDPDQDNLMSRFGETRRQIQYRLEKTMEIIRKAIGDSE